jgi:hypothetical protein
MQLSYEIDELIDRINMKKNAKKKEEESFFVTDEDFTTDLNKDPNRAGLKKKAGQLFNSSSTASLRLDSNLPLIDLTKLQ